MQRFIDGSGSAAKPAAPSPVPRPSAAPVFKEPVKISVKIPDLLKPSEPTPGSLREATEADVEIGLPSVTDVSTTTSTGDRVEPIRGIKRAMVKSMTAALKVCSSRKS